MPGRVLTEQEAFGPQDTGRVLTEQEAFGGIRAAELMGQSWVGDDIADGRVSIENYMQRASERIQEYQEVRDRAGQDRLTANEQVAIVDAFRQLAGLQPEGFYLTAEGAAIPRDRFAEIRRKRMEDDDWGNFKANLSSTTLQMANSIRGSQAKILDALGITEDAVDAAARDSAEIQRILQPRGGKSGFAGQAVGNVMNLFLAGSAAAPAMFAVSTAGSTFLDVHNRRLAGEEISPAAEWTAAMSNAAIEYTLEHFGQKIAQRAGMRLFDKVGVIRKAVAQNGARGGIKTIAKALVSQVFTGTGAALEGAAEEGITEIMQNTVNRLLIDEKQGIFENVGTAALQGAVMPLLAAGPMAVVTHGKPRPPNIYDYGKTAVADRNIQQGMESKDLAIKGDKSIADLKTALYAEQSLPENLQIDSPAETDIPDLEHGLGKVSAWLTDKWIGSRQVAETWADNGARIKRKHLKTLLREGETVTQLNDAMQIYVDMKRSPEAYQNLEGISPEQRALVERAQNLSPQQMAFIDQGITENAALGIEALDAEVIANYNENYSAIIWGRDKPGARKAKFTIATARARQRTLPSIIEGWRQGLNLEVPGFIESQMVARQQIAQVIHDKNLVNLGLKSKLFSKKRDETHTHKIEHPNFKKWLASGKFTDGGKVFSPNLFLNDDGMLFERTQLYTDKKTAKFLNRALGVSKLMGVPGVGTITNYNQIMKHMILTATLFHHQAYMRSFMLASRGWDVVEGYGMGQWHRENWTPITQDFVREGLTLGKYMDFDQAVMRESTAVGKIIDKIPMASEARTLLRRLSHENAKFLFENLGPNLKLSAAIIEYNQQMKSQAQKIMDGKITRQEILRNISNSLNDDFGGLNLQRIGRDPTLQHIFRFFTLASDWTESNVRMAAKALKRGNEGKVYRDMWGRVLAKGLGAAIITNMMMAGLEEDEDPDAFINRYKRQWENGNLRWLDVDITPIAGMFGAEKGKRKYFHLLGHFRDPVKFARDAPFFVKTGRAKGSVVTRMLLEAATGTNWRGQEFTSLGGLMRSGETVTQRPFGGGPIGPSQVPSYILKQTEQTTPIQVQAAIQRLRGEIDTFDMLSKLVGIRTATTYPKRGERRKRKPRTRRKR